MDSGWATKTRSASKAMDLARTRIPWSRVFLIEHGRGEYVDYLEGTRPANPNTDGTGQVVARGR